MSKVSIVVRTKNEERWISQCLDSIFRQDFKDFEVIIVDNESTDKTLEKAKQFNIAEIITCSDYLPGKALNIGIREALGEYIACISGHCIPVNNRWLTNLFNNFCEEPMAAGVYGRQEPMSFTSDSDKRDLALVFGLDRKVQNKDTFFHNANSMIRRKIWEEVPFDENATNIEDRIWAKEILNRGHKIVYEPEASVYHYHGIHQNGNAERCENVVRILDSLNAGYSYKSIDIEKLNIVAIIPVKGEVRYLSGRPLLSYTIQRAMESRYIKKTVVSTDNPQLAKIAADYKAEAPFIRDEHLSDAHVDLDRVIQYSLKKIEEFNNFPDLIVSLEATFPFRPKGLIDNMIEQLAREGLDSIVAARMENRAIWKERDNCIVQLDEGLTPRQFKEPSFIELRGIAAVTHPAFIRHGHLLGKKIGIYELNNPYSHIEVRNEEELGMASLLIKEYFK